MSATRKIIAVGSIGLSLGACGTTKVASNLTSTTFPPSTATTSTTLPPGTPIGFNASKTKFVLPHNLGLLPAPELALAKASTSYANGLANVGDWMSVQTSIGYSSTYTRLPPVTTWLYIPPGVSGVSASKVYALLWNSTVANISGPGAVQVVQSTSALVQDSTLHALVGTTTSFTKGDVPKGDQFVAATNLEIQAAPVGTLSVKGSNLPAFCVPTPESLLTSGKVSRKSHLPDMTAGPSTVFASRVVTSPGSGAVGTFFYDKGVATCNNFD